MTKPPQPEPSTMVAATAMYVEVLVIGIGFLSSIGVGVAAFLGPRNISHLSAFSGSALAAGASLAFAYALGILIDRASDRALSYVRRRIRAQHFESDKAYTQARAKLAEYPAFAASADYARSRMRICRGWVLNCAILTLTGCFAIARFAAEHKAALIISGTLVGVFATLGFYAAWRNITMTSYQKLAEQTSPDAAQVPTQTASHPPPSA